MKSLCWSIGLMVCLALSFWFVRPGIFVMQPIGMLPEGMTVIYYDRPTNVPVIASADGLCLNLQGNTSLFCRLAVTGRIAELSTSRVIARLPYSETAYLWTTGGQTFER